MEFHNKYWNQFQHASQPNAFPTSTSDGPAVPNDVFVNFYQETNDSESVATAPEIPQQAHAIPPRENAPLPNVSLDAGTSSRGRVRKMS
jgi:hypothetical protein